MKDVRAGEPWNQSADFLIVNPLTLDIYCVLIFTELDPKVLALIPIGAGEVFTIQFNILLDGVFNWTIGRANRDDSRGIIVGELVRLSFHEHLLPILVVERELKDSFRIQFCGGSSPREALGIYLCGECWAASNEKSCDKISEATPNL